jgi:hypothetical protein
MEINSVNPLKDIHVTPGALAEKRQTISQK